MLSEKSCSKCKETKQITHFYITKGKPLPHCKECDYLHYKRPDALKRLARRGKKPRALMTVKSEDLKKIEARARSKKWAEENRDRKNAAKRRRNAERNPPKPKVERPVKVPKPKLTAEELKANRKESKRLYRLKHPEKVLAEGARHRAKSKTRPEKVIARSLRRRLRKLLKGNYKTGTYTRTLGCTSLELKAHLEAQFAPGMTWDNYGTAWHIDHIRPLCSFDLTNDDELALAANFKNLQPLWAEDNLKKGGKWDGDR